MEKNNEILRKALSEALTDKYSGELNSAVPIAEEPSPEFTNNMNNLVRKTDRPFFQYAKYTLIAACACLIVGAAIIVPAFHINNMLSGGNNSMESVPGYGDSDMNMGADVTMAPSDEDGFRGEADEAPDSYPSDVPTEDSEESTKGDDAVTESTKPPENSNPNFTSNDHVENPNFTADPEIETYPDSERPITNAVLSQTLHYNMFVEASLHIMGGYYGKEVYTEMTVADHKAVVELIYDIFKAESIPDDDPTERDNITAYMKMCLNEGSMAYIDFTVNGNVYFEEGDTVRKVNLGEERISYYVNRILDEATEIGTEYPENQQGSTIIPSTSDETLADLLDGKEIYAFENAVALRSIDSKLPSSLKDETKLKELYKLIYTYGEDIKLSYMGEDPMSSYFEYVWIDTVDDGDLDLKIANNRIILGDYYIFYVDDEIVKEIYTYVDENSDGFYHTIDVPGADLSYN